MVMRTTETYSKITSAIFAKNNNITLPTIILFLPIPKNNLKIYH